MSGKENDETRAGLPADYELYIMRHGLATARDVTTAMDDAKRPLTSEGKQKIREIASGLVRRVWKWIGLYRARSCARWKPPRLSLTRIRFQTSPGLLRTLGPGGAPEALITFLAKRPNRRRVLVVGHEPDLGELAARLIGAGRNAKCPLRKVAAV